jgi:hypothetical protein
MAAPEDVEAFLATCAASGDAAYGAAKAVLERLQAPATRAEARRLLGAVRRRFAAGGPAAGHECFRTFHFRIHDVVLDPHLQGLHLPLFPPPLARITRSGCWNPAVRWDTTFLIRLRPSVILLVVISDLVFDNIIFS